MTYNFRKEQKELYVPGKSPSLINVPAMKYLTVRGHGDPNQENSEYKKAIEKLPSGDVIKLQSLTNDYRLRVGDLRVLFSVQNEIITIKDVLPRGQAYKRL